MIENIFRLHEVHIHFKSSCPEWIFAAARTAKTEADPEPKNNKTQKLK
jgi:hypothetical protein